MQISFSAITDCHYAIICNQVCYVIWCLEVIWLSKYYFIKVCGFQANVQFKVSGFVLALNQNKAVYPGSCFCDWLEDTCLKHLVYLLFTVLFKVNWYWHTRCLLGLYAWIQVDCIWETRKLFYSLKDIRIL